MKLKPLGCIALALAVVLSGCNAQSAPSADESSAPNTVSASDIVLDYAQGIADGIYGWTLSEDGSYYYLSAINEDGTPLESTAKQSFMGGGMGGGRGNMDGKLPDGVQKSDMPPMQNPGASGALPERGGSMGKDALAMEENQQAAVQQINAQGVYTESNITNAEYQTMLVFVPAAYMTLNKDGSAAFTDAQIGGYTAQTAPIVFQNNNMGWRSGAPRAPEYANALTAGMIYVSCGSRSRDALDEDGTPTGKVPTPVADLKAGVIALRANSSVIPGDKAKIISVGASGGGQMSSALGATGNMEEYYPYLYAAGAIGVAYDAASNTYSSQYDDSVYAAMAYCPIADIKNADLAYAWLRYDSTVNADGSLSSTAGSYAFSAFQLQLQEDAAYAFGEYINSLELTDKNGTLLTFNQNTDGTINLRSGSYYEATLQNISDALNAAMAQQDDPAAYLNEKYGETSAWLTQNADGSYQVTDLAGFINGTELVRNKDIPGFDALDMSAENDAFGPSEEAAVHFSASIAKLLQDNYDTYAALEGFDASEVDAYIENALTGSKAEEIAEQTYLVNATHILLDVAAGTQKADTAQYWRTRNGTADQHTSFSVAYNLALAAEMAGFDADYSLVWAMGHGSNEGTTTGTFVDWIASICAG